jgi:hypothetical protein
MKGTRRRYVNSLRLMRSLVLGYVLLAAFFAAERFLRKGAEARTLHTTPSDRGTTRLIGVTYAAAINAGWLAPLLSRRGWSRLTDPRLPSWEWR